MKKTIYIIALGVVLALSACSRDEKDLFDKSAAERVEAAEKALQAALVSASNGWEMQYFPYPDAAGYAFLCEFNKDGSVIIAAKNQISTSGLYKEETSCWTTDGTQGAVLSFSTFNSILHEFAHPGSDGLGYMGDYEFVCLNTTDDQIKLKGKKHGAYVLLNRLPIGQNWEDYFKAIDRFNEELFKGNDGIEMSYTDGDTIYQMKYDHGMFSYKNKLDEEENKGFVITPSGLHFYSGCPVAGSYELAKDFVLDADKTMLVNTINNQVFFSSNFSPAEFFAYKFEKFARWIYTEEDSDPTTVAAVNQIKQLAAANGAEITRIAYDYYERTLRETKIKTYCIYISYLVDNRVYEGRLNCSYTNQDGIITYKYLTTEKTLDALMSRIDANKTVAATMFADIFCGSWVPTSYTGTKLNMVQLLLTSTTDSNKFIHVIADITK